MTTTLVIGGTGPTGPYVVRGLEERGHEVTIAHTGNHELDEVAHVEHLHGDVRSVEGLQEMLGERSFDNVIATYGRLRAICEVFVGRTGHLISVGGGPVYSGYFDATSFDPPGMPVPTAEDGPKADESKDGKSYRVARTEELLFATHPEATHFRYPVVYGPRQLVPREWSIVRRILDGRPHIVLADGGQTLVTFGYVENLAHALMLAIDNPEAAKGEAFNCGDEECLTIRQVVDLVAAELDHTWDVISMPWELAVPARPLVGGALTTHRVFDLAKIKALLGYKDKVPARDAVRRTARWLAENPHEPGGLEERILEDPFDYQAEDQLIESWHAAVAAMAPVEWATEPGLGMAYGGPGTNNQRPDTRI